MPPPRPLPRAVCAARLDPRAAAQRKTITRAGPKGGSSKTSTLVTADQALTTVCTVSFEAQSDLLSIEECVMEAGAFQSYECCVCAGRKACVQGVPRHLARM